MDLRFSQFEILTGTGTLFVCLLFLAIFEAAPDIQEEIAVEAAAAAHEQGLYWAGVAAQGQHLVVTGAASDADARARALAAIEAVPGVAAVDDEIQVIGAEGGCQNAVTESLASRPVTFKAGRPDLTDNGMAALDLVAEELRRCHAAFEIASHTDNEGDATMNLQLSQRRSEMVVRYLVQQGVNPRRLRSAGYGESQPVARNGSDHGRAANQRLEFRILGEAA